MLNIRQDVRIFPTRALRLTEVSRLQGTLAQHGSVASREAGGALEASSGGRAEGSPETDGWGATNDVAPDDARRWFSRTLREDAGSRQEVTHENQIVFARLRSATFADEDFLRAGKNFFLSATVQFICNTLARRRSKPARPYICRLIIFSRFTCPSTWPLLQG